ncbi:MAG: DNA repair protein RecO [Gammaproteobacteria bacterium]|nr:DNA repair protein RecO [Gammaproteobacteria bacterium]MDH5628546.1 DNA repair protein RecO [Gammaproteobacteria bacterium]
MNNQRQQTLAYVLHSRAYQESSVIYSLFSENVGRFSVVAKGIKGKRSQAKKAVLQPFNQLLVEYSGKSDLKTLINCEANHEADSQLGFQLKNDALICGYYANELLIRCLPEYHEFSLLFIAYHNLLKSLSLVSEFGSALRTFEVALLTTIGIAPDWFEDIEQKPINPSAHYTYQTETGFVCVSSEPPPENSYSGQAILSLGTGEHFPEYARMSQKITSRLLADVLGEKPLASRKLWLDLHQLDV